MDIERKKQREVLFYRRGGKFMSEKNIVNLSGKVISIEESHTCLNETFYRFFIEIPRLSDNVDIVPVIVSEKLLYNNPIVEGDLVTITGQIRTRNQKEGERNRLLVFGYAMEITKITEEEFNKIEDKNHVEITGFICKKPVYRKTPTGRKISDLLIASNRQYNKSDYIPSIAWGINATFARNLEVGEKISLIGRFQSRTYTKKDENDNPIEKIAYEISISQLNVVKE